MNPADFQARFAAARGELLRVVVGHERAVEQLLIVAVAGGHLLLTGVPGLGRTLLVKSLATVLGLSFRRIQFTPDLLPTDITGTEVLQESADRSRREFRFFKGPVFANLLLADEINRSPARTQAALLEVMAERQVTVGGRRFPLPEPFLLVATQNSLESEGVYPLPEAQLDRFMLSIHMDYPDAGAELRMVDATTGTQRIEPRQVLNADELLAMRHTARLIPVAPFVKRYALAIVRDSRPEGKKGPGAVCAQDPSGRSGKRLPVPFFPSAELVRWGASPRAGQALLGGAKVLAAAQGRPYVTRADVRELAEAVLGHRIIPSFRAVAEEMGVGRIIGRLIEATERRLAPPIRSRRWRDILGAAGDRGLKT